MIHSFLSCGLLLLVGFSPLRQVQEGSDRPEAPAPRETATSRRALPKHSSEPASWDKPAQATEAVADLQALAASIAEHTSLAGCQPNSCTILVMNFTLPDGNTSAYGMQLADKLSSELGRNEYQLQVINRALLNSFLAKDRISAKSVNRTVNRAIAEEFDLKFMVLGTVEKFENGLGRLSSQLIGVSSKKWVEYNAVMNLAPLTAGESFEPTDPFPPLPAITHSASGEKLQQAGVDGTTGPSCFYMPNPPYSEEARKLKLSGSLTTEAVIGSDGQLENMRIVHGMMGGLNETTLETMRSWRCHPGRRNGKAVPVLVQFEVNFRLY